MNVKLANLLNEARKIKDLTQENLAEQVGVSPATISDWERNGVYLGLHNSTQYAKYLDLLGIARSKAIGYVGQNCRGKNGSPGDQATNSAKASSSRKQKSASETAPDQEWKHIGMHVIGEPFTRDTEKEPAIRTGFSADEVSFLMKLQTMMDKPIPTVLFRALLALR